MIDWDEETLRNIEKLGKLKIPEEGFELWSGITVVDTKKFLAALKLDIEQGPNGIRARFGAVQKELRRLVELFGEGS